MPETQQETSATVWSPTTTIAGNLAKDPEIRYTRAGQAQTTLQVVNGFEDESGEHRHSYFDVVCLGELAENVALSLTKGMRVTVFGRLQQRPADAKEGLVVAGGIELLASDVAVSMRFATVDVHPVNR